MSSRIRPLAVCLFSNGNRILVNEAHDPVKRLSFCRPIGGGIQFGETGAQAIERETLEELGTAIRDVRFVGTLENIFTYLGEPGHEIVLVFDAAFKDGGLYARPFLSGRESNGDAFEARWRELSSFSEQLPLFPEGLVSLVRSYWRERAA